MANIQDRDNRGLYIPWRLGKHVDGQGQLSWRGFPTTAISYSSNDQFAYGVEGDCLANAFVAYRRTGTGNLVQDVEVAEVGPISDPNNGNYFPVMLTADNAGHLAVLVNLPFSNSRTIQLASYSIDNSTGAISSTDSYENMPQVSVVPRSMSISWTGKLLAVGGEPGLQLFHFNGAAPASCYEKLLLPNIQIDQLAWDTSNLYTLLVMNPSSSTFIP